MLINLLYQASSYVLRLFQASSVVSTKIKAPAKSQSVRKPLSGFLSSADRLRFKSKVQNTKHNGDKDASARLNKTIR